MSKKAKKQSKVAGIPDQGTATAKKERPTKGQERSASNRPQRNARSIGEFRDILGLRNKEPGWRYRWVQSTEKFDKRIYDARAAGWEFVDASKESALLPGEYAIAKTTTDGSLYRIPAGRNTPGEYLYAMRMPEAYAQEVDAWKGQKVADLEADLFRERTGEDAKHGVYQKETHSISQEDRFHLED